MSLNRMLKVSILVSMLIMLVYLMPPILMPFSGIPITLQTWMILMIGLLLSPIEALIAVLIYVLLGAIGLPVFSGARGGIDVIIGPTGGFIIAFPVVSFLVSVFKSNQSKIVYNTLIGFIFMIVVLYGFAAIWFMSYMQITYISALLVLLPFVPFDMAKVLFAAILYQKMPLSILTTQAVLTKDKKYE